MHPYCGRVLLVEGDTQTGALLRDLLGHAGFAVSEAATGEEALTQAETVSPDLVMLDVDAPSGMAYVVCRLLREKYGESLPIIFTSQERSKASDRVAGLLIGADEYIVKPFDPSELVARVRRLIARSTSREADSSSASKSNGIQAFDLTPREQEILGLLISGLDQKEISSELVISSSTVATHIQRMLLKLGVHNRTQAVAKAAREGWFRGGERPEREGMQPASPLASNEGRDRSG